MKYASLCILAYERPDFLIRSFESLKRNTNYSHERIIHDDGSIDPRVINYIEEQADNWQLSYSLFNQGKNRGIERAMRTCIGASTGEYVFKLDTDLEFLPNWLESVIGILENNRDIACCGLFNYRNYDPADRRFEILETRDDCLIVNDFVNSGYGFKREIFNSYGEAMGDDGWQGHLQRQGFKLAIPKNDLVVNFGFGVGKSIYIQAGQAVVFNKEPRLFKI